MILNSPQQHTFRTKALYLDPTDPKNVIVAFRILESDEEIPPTFEYVPCHLVFDVKMNGTAKARLVTAGCRTGDSEGST